MVISFKMELPGGWGAEIGSGFGRIDGLMMIIH